MNRSAVQSSKDIGKDSLTIPRDAYGYTLYYYVNGSTITDYTPIGTSNPFSATPPGLSSFNGLYNGNIAAVSNNITKLADPWHYYTYKYDQLNRIKASHVYKAGSMATSVADYHEAFTYDGNGNIQTVSRYAGAATVMDSLTYHYNTTGGRLRNNRLNYINDAVTTPTWPYGLDDQNTNNYTYDAIGNMAADVTDTISNIGWSVYNKIQNLTNSKGTITYTYNPAGQRVSKSLNGLITWYIRDAQGNTLALYDNSHSNINWKEQELYGSSRLGMWQPNVNLSSNNAVAVWDTTGNKEYELDNHLGNVLATITDKRIQHASGSTINYYDADVSTAQEYYAFGGLMPQRTYAYSANNYYRYGFNSKENDNEVKGLGNQQDYGMRIYDPRVGKFLSVDPLTSNYPWYTPYQFAGNKPISFIDRDGEEEEESENVPELIDPDGVPESAHLRDIRPENEPFPGSKPTGRPSFSPQPQFDLHSERLLSLPSNSTNSPIEKFVHPSKLTDQDIKEISERLRMGTHTQQDLLYQNEIAKRFRTLSPTVSVVRESPFQGRPLIVDENLSPNVATELLGRGFTVITVDKGTPDELIIDYAKNNNAIVVTNNEKDFINKGITIFKVSENLKSKANISNLVKAVENVNEKSKYNQDIIKPGNKVNLTEHQ